ncbi:MAG: PQQ-binding-like beta-propeller repeat protein [Fimbriiglobus sp.]
MSYFAVLLACSLATPNAESSWPLFRGNAEMQGVAAAKLPDQLQELWSFKTGDSIESAPVVVGDVVYVGSMDKHLYAVDLKSGQEKWKIKLGSLKAGPAFKNGRIVVGDLEGKVHCVDTAGQKVWTFDTLGEIHGAANFVGEDVLIGSHDSSLYRIDKLGKKVWEFKIDGPVNGAVAVSGDKTFVAGCDSLLHVVDVNTGKPLGNVDLGGQAAATSSVFEDFVYVGTMANQVVAVNWKDRKKSWEFEAKRRQQPFYSSTAVTKDLVIAGGRDKKVYAIDRLTGKQKWEFTTEGNVDASAVVIGDRVYVGCLSNTGEFYVLDLKTGKQVQQLTLDSAVSGSVGVAPDAILVGTDKGRLYKLGAK